MNLDELKKQIAEAELTIPDFTVEGQHGGCLRMCSSQRPINDGRACFEDMCTNRCSAGWTEDPGCGFYATILQPHS